jgi:hypothetical protein
MNTSESIVLYRSKTEQRVDEATIQAVDELVSVVYTHPVSSLLVILVPILLVVLWNKFNSKKNRSFLRSLFGNI